MAIDIKIETLVRLSGVGDWYYQRAAFRPNRSTVHRWRTRGTRGVKLETVLIGGTRFTSEEKLQEFNNAVTAAADGLSSAAGVPATANSQANAFLDAEGI